MKVHTGCDHRSLEATPVTTRPPPQRRRPGKARLLLAGVRAVATGRVRIESCRTCNGRGLITLGNTCPICEGHGTSRRLLLSLPVITIDEGDGLISRVAVLCVDKLGGNGLAEVRGLTDKGELVAVAIGLVRLALAPTRTFAECETR